MGGLLRSCAFVLLRQFNEDEILGLLQNDREIASHGA